MTELHTSAGRAAIARIAIAAAGALLLTASASASAALTFDVEFRESTYEAQAGDTYLDLVAQHQSETLIQATQVDGLSDISTAVYAGGRTNDYSMSMTMVLDDAMAGDWVFQVGTDWGRGGAGALVDVATDTVLFEQVILDDVWWDLDWNNADVFTTALTLVPGQTFRVGWVGFEGCCGGSTTIRFSYEGSAFTELTQTNVAPYLTPEPGTAVLVLTGLAGLGAQRRSARSLARLHA